jgi:enamine deaminase RidA (YjgF/YER057c/UK114 family)
MRIDRGACWRGPIVALFLAAGTAAAQQADSHEARLKTLGITLPEVPQPVANYVPAVRAGQLLFLAGQGPARPDGTFPAGKVGRDFTVEQGAAYARDTCLVQLAVMRATLGSLDRVKRIVKVNGMVNAPEGFRDHPKVMNGCSDLLVAVFGEAGKHARAAVGMASLPLDIPVEIDIVAEVAD